MPQERQAIFRRWVNDGSGFSKSVRDLDVSGLEVGDHFTVSGSATLGFVRRQLAGDKAARRMRFQIRKITPYLWEIERTK